MTIKTSLKIDACKNITTNASVDKNIFRKESEAFVNKIKDAKKYIVYESDIIGLFGTPLMDIIVGSYPEEALLHTRPQFSSMYVEFISELGGNPENIVQKFGCLIETLSEDYSEFSIRPIFLIDDLLVPMAEYIILKTAKKISCLGVDKYEIKLQEDDIFNKFPKVRDDLNCTYDSALKLLRMLQSKSVGEYVHKPKKTFLSRKKCITKKLNEFRTLRIKATKDPKVINSEGRRPTPLSIGRDGRSVIAGHFATYTREKPLFGTPGNFGEFWIKDYVKNKNSETNITNTRVVGG